MTYGVYTFSEFAYSALAAAGNPTIPDASVFGVIELACSVAADATTVAVVGDAAGSITLVGAVVANHPTIGQVGAVLAINADVSAQASPFASVGWAIRVSGSVAGLVGVSSQAATTIPLSADAVGSSGRCGTVAGAITMSGAAVGAAGVSSSTLGYVSLLGNITGKHSPPTFSTVAATLAIDGSVFGTHYNDTMLYDTFITVFHRPLNLSVRSC